MKVIRASKGNYFQGHFVKISDPNGEIFSRNPGDLSEPGVPIPFSYEHIHDAVLAARRAFPAWKRQSGTERGGFLKRYGELLRLRADELQCLMSQEVGKPLWESREEINDTLTLLDIFLKEGSQTEKSFNVPDAHDSASGSVRFYPRGVVVIIIPAGQPLLTLHASMIPSLIQGNTVVFKPSKHAPLVAQFLAEIAHEVGIPAGVFNMIHGDSEASRRLVGHTDVDAVFFTGPYETGFKIKRQILSDYWKLLVLEMGGKNATIIWGDCDFDKALHETLYAAFATSGQRCQSTSRIIVQDKIFDQFLSGFHELSKKCVVGYGLDEKPGPFMGPLIAEPVMENYLGYQGIAVRENCEEIMRGKILERDRKGYYVSPSIHWVKGVDPKSIYQKSEIGGPDAAFYRAMDWDEALEILNHTQYGLVASVYTGARENYLRLLDEAKVGRVNWNRKTTDLSYRLPFGGMKKSGNQRPMGGLASHQCTYPVSSLENTAVFDAALLPEAMPRVKVL